MRRAIGKIGWKMFLWGYRLPLLVAPSVQTAQMGIMPMMMQEFLGHIGSGAAQQVDKEHPKR